MPALAAALGERERRERDERSAAEPEDGVGSLPVSSAARPASGSAAAEATPRPAKNKPL